MLPTAWDGVGIPARVRQFSLFHHVQTGPGAHPSSCSVGNGVLSPSHSGRGVKLTTHLQPVPRSRMSGSIPLLSLYAFMTWKGKTLTNQKKWRNNYFVDSGNFILHSKWKIHSTRQIFLLYTPGTTAVRVPSCVTQGFLFDSMPVCLAAAATATANI
jgi:hypothetical protein